VFQTATYQANRGLPHIQVEAIRGSESLGPIRNTLRSRGITTVIKLTLASAASTQASSRLRSTGSASSRTSKNYRLWKPVRCRSIHITRPQTCILPRARFIVSSQEPFQTSVGGTNGHFLFQYLFLICHSFRQPIPVSVSIRDNIDLGTSCYRHEHARGRTLQAHTESQEEPPDAKSSRTFPPCES
jgi:hypothetical protein